MSRSAALRHALTLLLFLGGTALLVGLAREIGLAPVREHARALVWFVPAALALHVAVHVANTLGWRYAIGPAAERISFRRLFGAWAAGDLVNWGTPGAFGGELLRAHLVRDRVPLNVGVASVAVARLSQTIAQFALVAIGLAIAWTRLDLRPAERAAIVSFTAGGLAFALLVYALQRTRLFGRATAVARRAGLRGRLFERIEGAFGRVDANMAAYHRDAAADFRRSVAWFFAGWALQILEVPLVLHAFGVAADWRAIVAIESLAILVEALAFLVPGKVGVDEGGRVLLFKALGYPAAIGLGFSIFRRARELVWFAFCLAATIALKRRADRGVAEGGVALASSPPPV